MNVKDIARVIRPQQWIKNVFVLVPLFFGGSLLDTTDIIAAVTAAMAFCFISSSIYCLNDIIDVEDDRRHPTKCHRPIAAGKISVAQAYVMMALMVALSFGSVAMLGGYALGVGAVVGLYLLMNVAYCLVLKRYAILDVCTIAFGFVLRLFAGGIATGIGLSNWIVLMTFLLTLFLSFAKRRDDVLKMNQTGHAPRKNTSRYNLDFINQAITITATVTLVCYVMYTVSPEVEQRIGTRYLYLTTVFVIIGILRYLQLTLVDNKSGDPTKAMLHDRVLQAVVLLWFLAYLLIIYILR
ncbi:decaprenyl-phosphate phosphoribosyltransferase [uncultured Prevotella sp.]|uniref:decaprenyl-phosphate phosphoribosyltransferase n=1 Tax=uncultured Prevotella sp. TaxID=159272 RepID=UPI002613DA47|nr:decaprenyl-phosphate phosphoribosyltransferase [uncultured Prevotella sp.]